MLRSELIQRLADRQDPLAATQIEAAVLRVLDLMADTLAQGERIEIRGFGSFCLHRRPPRTGRNPRTGALVAVPARSVPHFRPGKALKAQVDAGRPGDLFRPAPSADGEG
jgi:integration host factor subunit beta